MAVAQVSRARITLQGSAEMVSEFFHIAINSILFVRGLYGYTKFDTISKYGLQVRVTNDEDLKCYLQQVVAQLNNWLLAKTIKKVVFVIQEAVSDETIERWEFDIECDKDMNTESRAKVKPIEEIQKEIRVFMRQVLGSVHLLPALENKCKFDIQVHVGSEAEFDGEWKDSSDKKISTPTILHLNSFSTLVHTVKPHVAYKSHD
ncbi:hypothetical protein LOD99_14156 [Oopsacas minuta]|uniref:HORMA domain-containing protein n=1 Tax=Oopsacas minuta TaxID=111878 RepID=A0AAV7KGV9_9METZ|nr:hypothetical protein LOD99_14156 [Oopsacas minuta]